MGQRSWENIAGGVVATTGPLVAAGVCWGVDAPGWAPATLAAAVAAGVVVRDRVLRRPWSEIAFKATAGIAAAAWTTWSAIEGPWNLPNVVAGLSAAFVGWCTAPAFVSEPDAPPVAAPAAQVAPEQLGRSGEWKRLIEKIARVQPVTIASDTDWPNRAGHTLEVVFAAGSGDSWTNVRDAAARLAAAARLPKGCAISVEEGEWQGTAIVRVPTVYSLAGELPIPADTSKLSIWDDLPIGANEDTSPAMVNLRQASGLFVGQRGGGKTNLLKVMIQQLLRCDDTVVWVADLNGGGLAVPFMLPYAEGEVGTPPIDWVASTAEEVVLMASVAAAIAKDRKARYAGLTARSGGDLLPVTRDLPQITIVVDESAEVEDDPEARQAMAALRRVQRIGRAEGVNVLFSALRATQDTIPVSVRKQSSLKLCGRVEDDSELEYVLPGSKVRSEDLVHPGTFFLRHGDKGAAIRQIKVYRTLPAPIRQTVIATGDRRPTVDLPGQQIGGPTYADRMVRLRPWLERLAGQPLTPPAPAAAGGAHRTTVAAPVQTAPAPAPAPVEVERPMSAAERDAARAKAREEMRRWASRMQVTAMPQEQLDDAFGALVADLRPAQEQDGQDGAGWRPELLIEVAREAGPEGIGPTEMQRRLADRGITVSMKTVNKWVPRYATEGKLRKLDGGKYTA